MSGKKRFALIGHPLGHSLSPEIHAALMEEAGIDGSYELVDVEPEKLPAEMPSILRSFDGFNATIPHKKAVMPFLEGLSPAAQRCGAVNTVFRNRGFNTDAAAFRASGLPFAGARAVLLGTGGVA
ncbi:MAG: shikimate dehydrogenase, partial [Kiritimatiellae bacterium]|nr:shikimate dehydrogenase [Kiritimatiellia bacterium]